MADALSALRKSPIKAGHGGSAVASVTFAPPAARASLRAGADAVSALSSSLGLGLPTKPKGTASADGKHALWLGPDEWLLIGPDGVDFVALAGQSGALHSAVDVSHRNVAFVISGPGARATLASACPLDLGNAIFPVGAASRTVFGKAEVVIYRTGEESFRLECWRSFGEYCFGMLNEGAEDAAI